MTRANHAKRPADLYKYERGLANAGFEAIAGLDEAGRGACAGPLVVAAVILAPGRRGRIRELADSKLLTAAARDRVYSQVVAKARAWSVVAISSWEVDATGLHVANLAGMRRALARLDVRPDYALSDGYPVAGLGVPSLGVWKGDQVSASAAAAGVVAKVTRDRLMEKLHLQWPAYGFDVHKGYVTRSHREVLAQLGPCPVHRSCFAPVRAASGEFPVQSSVDVTDQGAVLDVAGTTIRHTRKGAA